MLAARGDAAGARRAYQEAIQSGHPDAAPTAQFNLGVLLDDQGYVSGARHAYLQAIRSGHSDAAAKATFNLQLIQELGDETGISVYQEVISINDLYK